MNPEHVSTLSAAISAYTRRGDQQVGWKLGFGSEQGKQTLGIDSPLVGALFESGRREPGADIAFADLTAPMVEPEIAAWIGADCPADASPDQLMASVSSLVPAIELADLSFAPSDPVEVLRGNIYQAAWVVAPDDGSGWGVGGDQSVRIVFGDQQWSQRKPESMTGSLVENLAQCNAVAHELGRGLLAGDVVFLGSVIPPQRVFPASFAVTLADGRSVTATFS